MAFHRPQATKLPIQGLVALLKDGDDSSNMFFGIGYPDGTTGNTFPRRYRAKVGPTELLV